MLILSQELIKYEKMVMEEIRYWFLNILKNRE